ncbi:MAG: hypothetical protein L6435_07950 [Anaerolineae bacterium]|nr:hypothetical protein [Anaerolineae bacterium]
MFDRAHAEGSGRTGLKEPMLGSSVIEHSRKGAKNAKALWWRVSVGKHSPNDAKRLTG